ncbi:MAG: TlpA family protein disulfide reductase [Dehalococcoidia bacterium]
MTGTGPRSGETGEHLATDQLRRRLSRALAGGAGALFLVLAVLGLGGVSSGGTPEAAPPFALELLEGGRVTNADLVGRVAVINVWASWCPPCREEAPALRRTAERFASEPVVFLGVVRDDSAEDALAFAREWGLSYPHAMGDEAFLSDFGARGIPMTYVLDANGGVLVRHYGPISESKLTALIEDALSRPAGDDGAVGNAS